jgi:hypothetical protein
MSQQAKPGAPDAGRFLMVEIHPVSELQSLLKITDITAKQYPFGLLISMTRRGQMTWGVTAHRELV